MEKFSKLNYFAKEDYAENYSVTAIGIILKKNIQKSNQASL